MATVQDILKFKENDRLLTIGPDRTVLDAIRLMSEHDIGCLIVMHDNEILGIITERDYARKIVLEGRSSSNTPVKEIMRAEIRCVGRDASIDDCRGIMSQDNIRYVPVVDGGYLLGLISISDVIGFEISEKDFLIDQLTLYVTGTHSVKMRR